MTSQLQQRIADEQEAWNDAARDYPEDGRWIVTAKRDAFANPGVVAGLIDEETGAAGDIEFVRRIVDGEWSLVPTHLLDD